ncbi:unnamed protein product [Aphanomyces euteiches]
MNTTTSANPTRTSQVNPLGLNAAARATPARRTAAKKTCATSTTTTTRSAFLAPTTAATRWMYDHLRRPKALNPLIHWGLFECYHSIDHSSV